MVNTKCNKILAWKAFQFSVQGAEKKTSPQAAEVAYVINCNPALHADHGINLVSKIQECYDRVWVHECTSIPASMAVALVRAQSPH